jgi:hypothetical protein
MRRMIAAVLVLGVLGVAGESYAKDKNGVWTARSSKTCSYYLDAYSRTTFTGDEKTNGPYEFWSVSAWIAGFISGINFAEENGEKEILNTMTSNDIFRWVGSWCRDNQSKSVPEAVLALIKSRS